MNTKLGSIIVMLLVLSGCVKETLDPCPVGNVKLNVYVEKFQTNSSNPSDGIEESFNKRIHDLHYYLYRNGMLICDTVLSGVTNVADPYYSLLFENLDFGEYRLLLVANSDPTVLKGDAKVADEVYIQYPGAEETDDYFTEDFRFSVECDCTSEYTAKLKRAHGVVRSVVKHLPQGISEVEITLDGVNSQKHTNSGYSNNIKVTKRYPVNETETGQAIHFILGTFPTPEGQPATYEIKFFASGQSAPVYTQRIEKNLIVQRNQLTEVVSDFVDGTIQFEIKMDSQWNDFIDGGGIVIQ